jgi:hypothetical protein
MTNGRRTIRRWGYEGNQLARHPHDDDVDDRGRGSGPFSSTGVARQQHADYLLHQKSVRRLLDEMDCAALGTKCTAAHQGQRSGVVAGECATRTNHARENPQCDECAIQPCTPVTISSMATLSNGCAKAPNAVVLPLHLRLKRYGIYCSATAARKNPGVLGRKHRTTTERTVRSAMAEY